jgi:quinol monooxygenase YgiN
MSGSLIVSAAGAVIAAIGSGVLLARFFRGVRADLIAWSLASLGLLVGLGAQAIGHLIGFDATIFRAMEIGGQVIAPLALILALSEVAAKSTAGRFCARLYVPSLAIIAVVVLALDQLTGKPFTKAWPEPSQHFQTPPDYVLMFAIGPVTLLIALITVAMVLARSGRSGWNAVLPAQLMGGAAAIFLAYPPLQQLAAYKSYASLPISSEFPVLCAAAAALTWAAGVQAGRVRLSALHGGRAAKAAPRPSMGWDGVDETGDIQPFDGSPYGRERAADSYRDSQYADPRWQEDGAVATGDYDLGLGADRNDGRFAPRGHEWDHRADESDDYGGGWRNPPRPPVGIERLPPDARAGLFGQIAIYTLLEDRVDDFDRLIERLVEEVRAREPDTLVYIVHAVPSAPMQRILYEVYRSREAYDRHGQQPYVRQFEADRRPFVLATNVIELGLQQAKVSPFPSVAELFPEPGYDTSGFERPDYLRDYGREAAGPAGGGGAWDRR